MLKRSNYFPFNGFTKKREAYHSRPQSVLLIAPIHELKTKRIQFRDFLLLTRSNAFVRRYALTLVSDVRWLPVGADSLSSHHPEFWMADDDEGVSTAWLIITGPTTIANTTTTSCWSRRTNTHMRCATDGFTDYVYIERRSDPKGNLVRRRYRSEELQPILFPYWATFIAYGL